MLVPDTIKGYAAAVISAITFGLNPFFGKQLYEIQADTLSVLFYRFFFATLMLGVFMLITHKPFVEKAQKRLKIFALLPKE